MSTAEETLKSQPAAKEKSVPFLNRVLDFLSSVRVGVITLCVLVVFAMIGMLIVQQNVAGFDTWYVGLMPAEKMVFGYLGFFDIYHSWYFNLLLLFLSLNIILASIDRWDSTFSYIKKPKFTATRDWLLGRRDHEVIETSESEQDAETRIKKAFEDAGYKTKVTPTTTTEYPVGADGRKDFSQIITRTTTTVFGQKGAWNRMGFLVVHVALLTLFLGHFVAFQTGFDADVRMVPGERTDTIQLIQFNLDKKEKFNVKLPFTIDCTDIEQKLIDENGGIDITNTLDWHTRLKVNDPSYGATDADVSLNRPFTYRGYRFFQAQTIPVGNARTIHLELTPQNGAPVQKVDVQRLGTAKLADGTKIEYTDFEPDFTLNGNNPDTRSADYNNPAAVLNVTTPDGQTQRVFAFAQKLPEGAPVGAPKAGYKWHLASFEKAPFAHVLSIKYDPFNAHFIAWYIGGFGLVLSLMLVFFFSHKRVWASIEKKDDGTSEIILAGEANRNQIGFHDAFTKIADRIRGAAEPRVSSPHLSDGHAE